MARKLPVFGGFLEFLFGMVLVGCGGVSPAEEKTTTGTGGAEQGEATGGAGAEQKTGGTANSGGAMGADDNGGVDGGERSVGDGGAEGAGGSSLPGPPDPSEIDCRQDGDGKTTVVFVNGCVEPVVFRGSDIEGGAVAPGEFVCVDVGTDLDPLSSKRYWGFIGEDPGGEHHTLAEFTFNSDFYDFDWYNISHVDAHNLPMQIFPVARPDCEPVTCAESWLASCPEVGKLLNGDGEVISCVSPERDNSQSEVALFFEACDDAYAWSGDDQEGDDPSPMHACAAEDWDIVFCPEDE